MTKDNIIQFPIKILAFLNLYERQELCAHLTKIVSDEISDYISDKKDKIVDIQMILSLFLRLYVEFMYRWFNHPLNKDELEKLEGQSITEYGSSLAKELLNIHFKDIYGMENDNDNNG